MQAAVENKPMTAGGRPASIRGWPTCKFNSSRKSDNSGRSRYCISIWIGKMFESLTLSGVNDKFAGMFIQSVVIQTGVKKKPIWWYFSRLKIRIFYVLIIPFLCGTLNRQSLPYLRPAQQPHLHSKHYQIHNVMKFPLMEHDSILVKLTKVK